MCLLIGCLPLSGPVYLVLCLFLAVVLTESCGKEWERS